MQDLKVPHAQLDIATSLSLRELAQLLSTRLFAGVPFIGENTGLWDEVPAVKLAERLLGLTIELGGGDGEYTLVLEAPDFAWQAYPGERALEVAVDITGYLAFLIEQIDGLTVTQ